MTWGFFKKLCIADNLAVYADKVFNNVYGYQGFALILATFFFTIQIYCDFSGYSDIARGTAKLFGIELMENFKSPYFSASIKEFWSRWHISLSTWFKDYVYIPLGGNRVGRARHYVNLMITFLVSGLWHGANWNFLIWGGVHGLAQIIENVFTCRKNYRSHGIEWLCKVLLTFTFCMFAWVFFRAQNFSEAVYVLKTMFYGITSPYSYVRFGLPSIGFVWGPIKDFIFYMSMLLAYELASSNNLDVIKYLSNKKTFTRWIVYVLFIMLLISLMPLRKTHDFVYFQF